MKIHKLLVIVASVCLMAFFNVSSFAQNAPGQPALASSMAEVLAQSLAAQGYDVERFGNSLKFTTNHGELSLDLPATGEELEDSGIRANLVSQADMSAEDIENFQQLQLCLNAADLNYSVTTALCELYVEDAGDFLCKIEATFDRILSSLNCIALYVDPPPPTGDVVSVFVTEEIYQGNLGGLAGADAICQERADAAELGGTDWTAWLSTSDDEETETPGINAIDRIPVGQYRLVDGATQVANDKADLTDGRLKAAIVMNEFGEVLPKGFAWTGTEPDGTNTGNNCNNWTVNSSDFVGDWGFPQVTNEQWTKAPYDPAECSKQYHLYCFGGVE
jgi:hypothetical protein